MSFGYSIGDVILLSQLAWTVVQNSRKACGEHDELTREVSSLHVVLHRLEYEVAKPESPINRPGGTCGEELEVVAGGCRRVLKILDQILEKYLALSETERSGRKLWQKIKFGNGKMTDLADLRGKMTFYTSALSLLLNMVSLGTIGRVEQQMNHTGGDLKEIRLAVNDITAHLMTRSNHEGSVLTAYPDDDRAVWKEFRRELVAEGFSSSVIQKHKYVIKAYIKELGARGLLDDPEPQVTDGPSIYPHSSSERTSTLTAFGDAGTAESQSSALPAAGNRGPVVQTSPETNADPLPNPEVQSNTKLPSNLGTRSDLASNFQLTKNGIADVQGVTTLSDLLKDSVLTTVTERPRLSHRPESLGAERLNIKHSTDFTGAGAQPYCADKSNEESGEGLIVSTPKSRGTSAGVVAAAQAINPTNDDYGSLQEIANPGSPAEVIGVVSDAWHNEYLRTSQYPNMVPSCSAKKMLRDLLPKLNAVNLKAVGWSNEFKACRAFLINDITIRLYDLERRTPTLSKLRCRSRCLCKSVASDNAQSIKDFKRLFETSLDLAGEVCDDGPPPNSMSRFITGRRLEILGIFHRIWHDHYDRVASLCLEWFRVCSRTVGMSTTVMYRKLITCMRENKQQLEILDLNKDLELTARRQELTEDIKIMVSSLRIFRWNFRWKWTDSGIDGKGIGQRVYLEISWVKSTITCCLGTKCGVCSAS